MSKGNLPTLMIVVGVFFLSVLGSSGTSLGEEVSGAPPFTLPNLKGQAVRLTDLKGDVVLINFWATWCRDCVLEMPELEKLYRKFRNQGLSLLAIALDKEGQPAVEAFLQKENLELTYPVLLDPDERVARAYGLSWVPVTIVVGRGGKIIETIFGARPWGSQEVMNSFEQLLNTAELIDRPLATFNQVIPEGEDKPLCTP